MTEQRRKQALGKGLGALLGRPNHPAAPVSPPPQHHGNAAVVSIEPADPGELLHLPIEAIGPNPRQPRRAFETEALQELAESIREHGVLQPILVTRDNSAGRYVLLAGERRLRASQLAERDTIPARIIAATEVERLELALIENVQREDLDPVEEARAYDQLASIFGLSQEQISKRVGKNRVTVANAIRLLRLPEKCLQDLQRGALTPGHARAILMLAHPLQQEELRERIVNDQLSVREAEALARRLLTGDGLTERARPGSSKSPATPSKNGQIDLDVVALQERITERLGCKVRIRTQSASKGTLEVAYSSLDDLDRVLEILGVQMDS